MPIKVGDAFPTDPVVHIGFAGGPTPCTPQTAGELMSAGKVPGLKKAEIDGRIEEAGIDKVYVVCVNDGAVMTAWKKDQGLAGSELIEFVADTSATLTTSLDLLLTGTPETNANLTGTPYADATGMPPLEPGGPNNVLGAHTKRCKRSAMFVVDGIVKAMAISEAPDDPAGDARPEASCIENMLELIAKV